MSGHRISPKKIRRVERLLKYSTLSHRQIAKTVGISKSTIDAVATDTRKLKKPAPKKIIHKRLKEPVYCEGCERMIVLLPCVACECRRGIERQQLEQLKRMEEYRETEMRGFVPLQTALDSILPNINPCGVT